MDSNNGFSYCENSKCLESCSLDRAICMPYYKKGKNDISLNICKCNIGWQGDDCDIKQFIDYR